MLRFLRFLWKFLASEGNVNEAVELTHRTGLFDNRQQATQAVETVQKAIQNVGEMRENVTLPMSHTTYSDIYESGYVMIIRTEIGEMNPVQFEFQVTGSDTSFFAEKIYQDLMSGNNYYGISPRLVRRILDDPEDARAIIDVILPRIIAGKNVIS